MRGGRFLVRVKRSAAGSSKFVSKIPVFLLGFSQRPHVFQIFRCIFKEVFIWQFYAATRRTTSIHELVGTMLMRQINQCSGLTLPEISYRGRQRFHLRIREHVEIGLASCTQYWISILVE